MLVDRRGLAERRVYPRYALEFSVSLTIETSDGFKFFSTECVNVSQKSIELICDNTVVEALFSLNKSQCYELVFQLPNTKHSFIVDSKVLTNWRVSQYQYYLVMSFTSFYKGNDAGLNQYLESLQSVA